MLLECLLPDGSSRPGSSMTEKASQANAVTQNYTIPAEFQRFFNHPATISPRKRLSRAPRGFSSCAGQSTKSRRPTARPPLDEKKGVVHYSDTTPLCMILFLRLQPERRGGRWSYCCWLRILVLFLVFSEEDLSISFSSLRSISLRWASSTLYCR